MFIYMIRNNVNGKLYIGQTISTLKDRFIHHKKPGFARHPALFVAMNKYGRENFSIHELDTAKSLEELNLLEPYYIQKYNSLAPNGYNLQTGGGNSRPCSSVRKKMSEWQTGKGNHQFGKKKTEEQKKQISKSLKALNRKWDDAHKKLWSKARDKEKIPICCSNGITYESICAASLALGICKRQIRDAAKGRQHSAGGYRFARLDGKRVPLKKRSTRS